ncbi:MAG: glycosyl hydrolase, partial [Cohnella sp.]|nr:glycosyl hydrolase [Cohnella sp.]
MNKNATAGARELLKLLYEIKGKNTLSGQHDYLEMPDHYSNIVKQLTGKYPAINGYELGGIMNQTDEELAAYRDNVIKSAIAWHKSGGIVTITYHMNLPDGCYCWDSVNNGGISTEKFKEII